MHSSFVSNPSVQSNFNPSRLHHGKSIANLQIARTVIQASTADGCVDYVLQPKQTGGFLHGLFADEEKAVHKKDDGKKVRRHTFKRNEDSNPPRPRFSRSSLHKQASPISRSQM